MFILGLYGARENSSLKKKIASIERKYIKSDKTLIDSDPLYLVAGMRCDSHNQGRIHLKDQTLVIGKVFRKSDFKGYSPKDLEESYNITDEGFVNAYWGSYLRFTHSKQGLSILRDPVGQLPLFYMQLQDGSIMFSNEISYLFEATGEKPDVNWAYCSSYIMNNFITSNSSVFKSVMELYHGCSLRLSHGSQSISIVWDPSNYCSEKLSGNELFESITTTTSSVIKNWVKDTSTLALDFSGGLDSTSLLFLLNEELKEHQKIIPINFFHSEVQSSDERSYALKVGKELDLEIREFDIENCLPFTPLEENLDFKPNWPTAALTHLKMQKDLAKLMKNHDSHTFISGHGGDHIFLCPPPKKSLCDYFLAEKDKNLLYESKNLGAMYRTSVFPLLGDVMSGFFARYVLRKYQRGNRFRDSRIAPWFSDNIARYGESIPDHPFFEKSNIHLMPGKFCHVDTIYSGLATIKGNHRHIDSPLFYPLFSQPLLELALSIPTYKTYHGGYNRYPFRKAISDMFGTNTVWRKDKGETSGINLRGLRKNRDFVFELCLEGRMAQEKLVDKDALYINLKKMLRGNKEHQWNILSLVSLERFFRFWY